MASVNWPPASNPTYPGGRAHQTSHRVLLLILGHIDANHVVLVVEQILRKRAGEFGFADASRAEEGETADRAVRILQSCAGTNHRFRNSRYRFILPDHAPMQLIFQLEQLLHFAFEEARNGNTRPAADYCRDILLAHFLLNRVMKR